MLKGYMMERLLMLGNEAVARAVYEAGATVATAYPGTPSTEITANIAKFDGVYCEWSPNEKVALEVAIGASISGARAICCMKHVGLNVAADPLFTASYTGVNGGLVVVVADDPGMHSSQNEQDSRWYGVSAKVPVLEPSDSGECLEYVKEAFKISEDFDTPVIVRLSTRVSHSRGLVSVSDRVEYEPRAYIKDAGKYVMMPAMARNRHVVVEKRMAALAAYAEATHLNKVMQTNAADAGGCAYPFVITSGVAWQYTHEALQGLGLAPGADVPVLKLGMAYPLPANLIKAFLKGAERALVVEELSPFYESAVKTYGLGVRVAGKDKLPAVGELTASLVRGAILDMGAGKGAREAAATAQSANQAGASAATAQSVNQAGVSAAQSANQVGASAAQPANPAAAPAAQPPLPVRPPVLCPGCPHRSVFMVLKKLKLVVCGDIGCYTLGALPPYSAMDACVCMGASIGMAHGMDKARGAAFSQKTVAVIGDSTFIHSGVTGLIDVVYNKGSSTVLILDNGTTGMTGHQNHPSTGLTIRDEVTYKLDIEKLCGAIGVESVRVVDPYDLKALENAVAEEIARPAPSVIIVRGPCVFLKSYKPGGTIRVDAGACTGCRLCMSIGCAAISTADNKARIDQSLCARCGLCAKVCRFGAIGCE